MMITLSVPTFHAYLLGIMTVGVPGWFFLAYLLLDGIHESLTARSQAPSQGATPGTSATQPSVHGMVLVIEHPVGSPARYEVQFLPVETMMQLFSSWSAVKPVSLSEVYQWMKK